MTKEIVWSETKKASNGMLYPMRYLHTNEEMDLLQSVGLVGTVHEVIGMQQVADSLVAGLEKEMYTANGGVVQ